MTRVATLFLFLTCAMNGDANSLGVREGRVELRNTPVSMTLQLNRAPHANRHAMLRIEGISVAGEVNVWEVRVNDVLAGTLSTYGAEASNGKFVAAVPVPRTSELSLRITFTPTNRATGVIRFQRLRVVEE